MAPITPYNIAISANFTTDDYLRKSVPFTLIEKTEVTKSIFEEMSFNIFSVHEEQVINRCERQKAVVSSV